MNKVADNSTHQIKKENENIPQFVSATDASLFDDSSDITFKNSLNTNNIDTLIKSPSTTSNNKNNFHCYISSYSMNKQETNDYTLNNYVNNEFDDNNDETITNSNDELDDDDDDDDEPATTSDDSQFSNLSGLSDLSGQEWKPIIKPLNWLQKQIHSGADPRELLSHIYNGSEISPDLNDLTLWKILGSILSEPPRREKLKTINTLKDVLYLLKNSKNIIILTGAGVSVSCGIPDFRSNDGIYSRLAKDFPDLPDPQAMFDINYFSKDPRPFYKFAREIYPGQFKPSPCHRFIKLLELKNKLLRNYTQNIDTLEKIANINNVIECHGSFATASCTKCKYKQSAESIRKDIFAQKIPLCPKCQPNINESPNNTNDKILFSNNNQNKKDANTELHSSNYYRDLVKNGIMKPDIVFFGEGLPDAFHTAMGNDKDKCDLLIVIGSSLKVRPVALVPSSIPPNVPQILINRERLNHLEFDVELLGDSDIIINQLCHLLGDDWDSICWNENILEESLQLKSANKPLYLGENISSSVNKSKILNLDVSSQSKKLPIITHNSSSNSSSISDNSSSSTINYIGYSDSGFDSSSSVNSGTTTPAIQLSNINSTITKTTSNNELHLSSYQKISTDHQQKSSLQEETAESNSENGFFKNSLIKSQDTLIKCDKITNSDIKNKEIVKPLDCECGDDDNDNINSTNSETNRKCHHDVNLTTAASSSSSWLKKSNLYTSAAERLLPNTYYCHKSTCSYIFEGAQVYLSSDESDIDDDDNNENNEISSSKIQEDAKIVEINSTPDIENLSNLPNFPITQNCKINTTETSTSSSNIGVKRSASYIYTDGESELLPTSFKFKKR